MEKDVLDGVHEIRESLPSLADDLHAVHRTLQERAQAVLDLGEPQERTDVEEQLRQVYTQMEEVGGHLVEAQRGLLAVVSALQSILGARMGEAIEEEHEAS